MSQHFENFDLSKKNHRWNVSQKYAQTVYSQSEETYLTDKVYGYNYS